MRARPHAREREQLVVVRVEHRLRHGLAGPTSLECMRNVARGGARAYVTEWKVLRCNAFLYLAQRVHFYDG